MNGKVGKEDFMTTGVLPIITGGSLKGAEGKGGNRQKRGPRKREKRYIIPLPPNRQPK